MPDRYAGIAGMTVSRDGELIVLDLSTPEQPEHTRLRLDVDAAIALASALCDAVDGLSS